MNGLPLRLTVALGVVVTALLAAGCGRKSCLRGDCEEVRACDSLSFRCGDGTLYVGTVADAPVPLRLVRGDGAGADILISNNLVTAVIAAIDAPRDLAPTGGTIIDLAPVGGADDLTLVYQIAGLLPDDALAYERLELVDRSPDYVAVVARGRLDGRPEIEVVTRYELRPCDPGVRVRTELFNGSAEVHAFVVADVPHWGKRRALPLSLRPGQGYVYPELDLLELASLYDTYELGAAAAPLPDSPGYGVVGCNQAGLDGVNDLELSAWGTPPQLARPGDTIVIERFWATAGRGQGPAPAIERALEARQQLVGDAVRAVAGRVVADDLPFGGDARRASILISAIDGEAVTPLASVVPDADGTWRATVPRRADLRWELWSFGRPVASGAVPGDGVVGDIAIDPPAVLQVAVEDDAGEGLYASVVLVPSDAATEAAVRGTFHGQWDACAPWLGPPHGGSPACNRLLVDPTGGEAEVPAGTYDVYATAGPDWTLARQAEVTLVAGEITPLTFALTRLDVVPAGWLRADLHVHGRRSFDSAIPDHDRVRSFVAAGIDVIAATDHDFVTDYAEAILDLGVGDRVVVLGGIETTQLIPWLELPGEDFPRVIGHFNFWPIEPDDTLPRGGAPWDEKIEPGALFDRMGPLVGDDGVIMMNHPWDEPQSGRDLGYLRAIEFDPRRPIPERDDGTGQGMLVRAPGGGHRNLDWDVIEVQNGPGIDEFVKTRPLWWSLLSQGYVYAGAANSDSHGLTDAQLGWGRTLVDGGGAVGSFDVAAFDAAVRDGRTVGGSGILIDVRIVDADGAPRRGLGLEAYVPAAGDEVTIEVRAAPWIPVSEVRAVTSSGVRVIASDDQLATPADPFGVDGVVRWQGRVAIDELVGAGDDWFVIEAGLPLPPYADLDDDGVPDTGDNDGDGDVDRDDVEDAEDEDDVGPLRDPPDPPRGAEDDPRYWMTRVVPRAFPVAFTSPVLVDRDGDGWTAPGLGGAP